MSSGHVHKSSAARGDLETNAAYLLDHGSVQVALRFLDRAEETFALLAQHPGFGRRRAFVRPDLEGLRSFRVKDFENYLVFYLPRESGIEVVRVLHGAQDLEALFESPDG
ncbi:MAG: type II toxin-antitoxin system RelE/ParE family toxin [Planctomycetota bacterium]